MNILKSPEAIIFLAALVWVAAVTAIIMTANDSGNVTAVGYVVALVVSVVTSLLVARAFRP